MFELWRTHVRAVIEKQKVLQISSRVMEAGLVEVFQGQEYSILDKDAVKAAKFGADLQAKLTGGCGGVYNFFLLKKGHGRDHKLQRSYAAAERHGRGVERVGFISFVYANGGFIDRRVSIGRI
jgi:hypothetical protein